MAIPDIEVSATKTKISDENGMDRSEVTFSCINTDIDRYEIRATKTGETVGRGIGLLVGKDNTLFPSSSLYPSSDLYPHEYNLAINTNQIEYVDDEEITNGDSKYVVTVYAREKGTNNWNDSDYVG